jgi:NAD(P)-dependent dehydrogenase (short-subunit alcohol dehydrogenase family)
VGPHYASSKSALHGIIHWIAQRYARDGVVSLSLVVFEDNMHI